MKFRTGELLQGDDHIGETFIPSDADYIVVGRPILQSKDPIDAYARYFHEIKKLSKGVQLNGSRGTFNHTTTSLPLKFAKTGKNCSGNGAAVFTCNSTT